LETVKVLKIMQESTDMMLNISKRSQTRMRMGKMTSFSLSMGAAEGPLAAPH